MSEIPRSMEATGAGAVARVAQRRRAQPSGWWGMALLIATEATLFSCLIATYFYLRFENTEWPMGGIEKPSVTLPLVFTAMLVATCGPVFLAVRAAKRGAPGRAWWWLALAFAVQATYLGLQIWLFADDLGKFSPSDNAYGSIYFTLLGTHHAHVAVGLLLDSLAALEAGPRHHQLPADRPARHRDLLVLRLDRGGRGRPHPALPVAMKVPQAILDRVPPTSPASLSLWYAVLGAPAAWVLQMGVGYWLSEAKCSPAGGPWGISLTIWGDRRQRRRARRRRRRRGGRRFRSTGPTTTSTLPRPPGGSPSSRSSAWPSRPCSWS